MAKKYTPNEKEKYMCEKHKAYFKKRLIARPIATLSIEAQEKHEKNEKIFADN